jgi:hypothetical protein
MDALIGKYHCYAFDRVAFEFLMIFILDDLEFYCHFRCKFQLTNITVIHSIGLHLNSL